MNIYKEARVLLSGCLGFYPCYIKFNDKNLNKFYFKMQKSSCVYPSLIDIHAITQNVQLQYTRNSTRKPTPNKYSRN